jgi:hypothetical protein
MYGKSTKPGTLQTAQMICSKEDFSPLDGECITRKMTPEDWEKYGPLNTEGMKVKEMQKSKAG